MTGFTLTSSKTGAVIAAASEKSSRPMLQLGEISILKRIVITMQQAGIFPVVIIMGAENYDIQYERYRYGVIFLRMENAEQPTMMESLKLGLSYLKDKCERVMVMPVNVPMVSPQTLVRMIRTEGEIVKPTYHGRGGHPILLSAEMMNNIEQRYWNEGLKEFLFLHRDRTRLIEVDDPGILMNVHNVQEMRDYLEQHNTVILRPHVNLTIEKERPFFDSRIKLLLYLISDTNNVRRSCEMMGLSYSKAWTMLNGLEKELGWKVVERCHGGSHGGRTRLTERGLKFVQLYQDYEEELSQFAQNRFHEIYEDLTRKDDD